MVLFVAYRTPLIILTSVALGARNRINSAVDFVLAQVVATMRERAFGRIGEFIARFDFFLVSVTVATE
jgi:hypothetical protein